MKTRWSFLVVLAFFTVGIAVRADEHPVTVKANPPRITRHRYDPAHRPAAMPQLAPGESGVCHYEFTSDAGIGSFVDEVRPGTVEVEVDSMDVVLDLPIDIWVMNNAPKKLSQHEEGHRQICEDYYKGCRAIALDLGRKMIGRKATASGRNKQEAQGKAQEILLTEFNTAFMQATRYRCRICQDHYDEITTHGLKPIGEAEAIAQAKELEKAGKIPAVGLPKVDPIRSKY